MDLDSLLGLIEYATKSKDTRNIVDEKEQPSSIPNETSQHNRYREGYEELLKDIDALLGSKRSDGSFIVDPYAEMEAKQKYKEHMDGLMQNRAKDLTLQYNLDKEKLDLRMKIEQVIMLFDRMLMQ